jgi:hypothetical protein
MVRFNPNPDTGGFAYMPIRSVTSRFPAGHDVIGAVQELTRAGFAFDQIDVFSGHHGANQLDTQGLLHGVWIRFVRSLEDIFTDESKLFHRANETMRAGGSVVAVFTAGEEAERRRASDILTGRGGLDTVYWGRWVTEYMTPKQDPVADPVS